MKLTYLKRFIVAVTAVLIMTAMLSLTVFAKASVTDVSSAKGLENALKKEVSAIRIVKSFTVDRTFYVTKKTAIYADKAITLTRSSEFEGDIFVVGESKKGESSLLMGHNATLTLGKKGGKSGSMLTIDGNRDKMKVKVNGTLIFMSESSCVNIYPNVTLMNAEKTANKRAVDKKYCLSTADRVGGAAIINACGTLNIYGGIFKNNSVNSEKVGKDADNSFYTSTQGGAIYNFSNLNISGGTFEGNTAARGGAIYNCDTLKITKGSFLSNSATAYGGAVYQHGTLKASASIGEDGVSKGSEILFKNNKAKKDGGAFYVGTRSNSVIYGNVSFSSNKASDNGGAIADFGALLVNNASFSKNTASDRGGAVYIATCDKDYVTRVCRFENSEFKNNKALQGAGIALTAVDTKQKEGGKATVTDCTFASNKATSKKKPEQAFGGAIYLSRKSTVTVDNSVFENNTAITEGGAVYANDRSKATVTDSSFLSNSVTSEKGIGGAVLTEGAAAVLDVITFKGNSSNKHGGAVGALESSNVTLNKIKASANTAKASGGFIYSDSSVIKVYSSNFSKNKAKNGGAVYLNKSSVTKAYKSKFTSNSASANGGAVYAYTSGGDTVLQDCNFSKNTAKRFGGAVMASKSAKVSMFNNTATANSAKKSGGVLCLAASSNVSVSGLKVSKNTAGKGYIIYSVSKKANLSINKKKHTDSDEKKKLSKKYWKKAIAGELTVKSVSLKAPSYSVYKRNKKEKVKTKKHVPVKTILNLGKKASNGEINASYGALKKLDNSSNFMSRGTTKFSKINGKTVTVDTFVYRKGEKANNCSVGEGLLIYQAMLYKAANPKEEVSVSVSSYRYSVQAAVNINRNSRYFGYMRNLVGKDYDEYGFVRISYLLVTAARMGIHVNVIGQIDGFPGSKKDPKFEEYFASQLNDACDPAYVKKGVVGDYLNAVFCKWTLKNSQGSTDMMHVKVCAVSHYLDMNGKVHKNAVWSSSTNLDGIRSDGKSGNSKLQTATIISDHAKIYQVSKNYIQLMMDYGTDQDDIYIFRKLVNRMNTEQIDLILAGKEKEIPADEQIVYLGSSKDKVFEFYYTPFGGGTNLWDEKYNPYCKYVRKLYNSEDYIITTWNNARFSRGFPLGAQTEDMIIASFNKNANTKNKLFLNLVGWENEAAYSNLIAGRNIGYKSLNRNPYGSIHNKDLQLSYVENGKRYYVSLLNSLNFHGGALSYQTNNMLVIKETDMDKDSVFYTVAKYSTTGIA